MPVLSLQPSGNRPGVCRRKRPLNQNPRHRLILNRRHQWHVLNHTQSDYFDQLSGLTDENGVDLILEMLSNVNLARDLTALAMGGRIVVIGCRGTIEINPREAMMREADIRGMALFNATPKEISSIHRALGAGLANGTLRPVVGRRFPLSEAVRAHVAVLEPGAHGKIVLVP